MIILFLLKASAGFEKMPSVSACRLDILLDNEAKLIGFAAGVLQISEYELFRIAYRDWFNHPVSDTRLDLLFKNYLASGDAPYWVHDFSRKVHEKFKAGELDYKEYGIVRRVCDRRTRIKGWIIVFSLIMLLALYSFLITQRPPY
jgi:hypothetical protein